jgi:flagellar basal body-associated protein FliL
MKLPPFHASRITPYASRPRRRQSGSAVIIVMALVTIILVYVAANIRTLSSLGHELKLLERQQTRRLQMAAPKTNAPPAATTISTNLASRPPAN